MTLLKMRLERMVALLLLAIPAALGIVGWKWMKEAVFFAFGSGKFFSSLLTDWHTYVGFLFFAIAALFIGGFLYHRDAKQNRIQPRLRRNSQK